MPPLMNVVLGTLLGLVVIAGAIVLAVRPYLRDDVEPRMPDAKDNRHDRPNDYAN